MAVTRKRKRKKKDDSVMATMIGDNEAGETRRITRSTRRLLERLQEHHSYAVPDRRGGLELESEPVETPPPEITRSMEAAMNYVEPLPLRKTTTQDIKLAVCRQYTLKLENLDSVRRLQKFVDARHVTMYLCREHLPHLSLSMIGRQLRRDHTTVLHGARKIERMMKINPELACDIAHIEIELGIITA